MDLFITALNQTVFLILLIGIGFLLSKLKIAAPGNASFLSKLESNVFMPALVFGTFMQNFTLERLSTAWQYVLIGTVVSLFSAVSAIFLSRLFSKDHYIRNLYTYGFAMPNFGFMGNAVVAAVFPAVFSDYLVFVIPFWILIYVWGVPSLLTPGEHKSSLRQKLLRLVNPMFIAMIVGMIAGLLQLPIPGFIQTAASSLGGCMSPVAMLLTGMTVAQFDLRSILKKSGVYAASVVRLFLLPAAAILAVTLLHLPHGLAVCTVCVMAMPFGLNTIIIPSVYEKDTSEGSGMVLISHLMSAISIPLVFMLFQTVFQ